MIGVKQLTMSKIVTIIKFLEFIFSPIYPMTVFTVDKGEIHKDIPVDLVGPNEKMIGKTIPNPNKGPIESLRPVRKLL